MYIILNIHTAKFEFSFMSLVNCPSQFLSHWETLFCSKELSFLCYKNQNKSTILYIRVFSTESQKSIIIFWLFSLTPNELYLETSLILAGQVLNAHHIIPLRLTYCEIAWPELGQPSAVARFRPIFDFELNEKRSRAEPSWKSFSSARTHHYYLPYQISRKIIHNLEGSFLPLFPKVCKFETNHLTELMELWTAIGAADLGHYPKNLENSQ